MTVSELARYLGVSEAEAQLLVDKGDNDDNGQLSFGEFTEEMTAGKAADVDQNGVLSPAELTAFLGMPDAAEVASLIDQGDLDQDTSLSLSEFEALGLTSAPAEAREADTNGDAFISADELKAYLEATDVQVTEYMAEFDINPKDNKLSFGEFAALSAADVTAPPAAGRTGDDDESDAEEASDNDACFVGGMPCWVIAVVVAVALLLSFALALLMLLKSKRDNTAHQETRQPVVDNGDNTDNKNPLKDLESGASSSLFLMEGSRLSLSLGVEEEEEVEEAVAVDLSDEEPNLPQSAQEEEPCEISSAQESEEGMDNDVEVCWPEDDEPPQEHEAGPSASEDPSEEEGCIIYGEDDEE